MIGLMKRGECRGQITVESAEAMRSNLDKLGITSGAGVQLLSSALPLARQTADFLEPVLGARAVISPRISEASVYPHGVRDLGATLSRAMEEGGYKLDASRDLIVVTHSPLIRMLKGLGEEALIAYGEIAVYEPGTWHNPEFSEAQEAYMETYVAERLD